MSSTPRLPVHPIGYIVILGLLSSLGRLIDMTVLGDRYVYAFALPGIYLLFS
jgi:hypothetical protein